MHEWQNQRDTIGLRLKILETISAIENEQFKKVPAGAVNAGGNLSFDRFSDICHVMMIDPQRVIQDQEYLDSETVGVRNKIAHGDYVVITEERLTKATDFVLEAMRAFRTDIENCVVERKFAKIA